MNSLQELNSFGNQILDHLDSRPSGVIFDRQYPLLPQDQELNISTTTLVPEPGIEIEEIINYQTANVRYEVSIVTGTTTPLTGSTISWASLPSGATLSQVGDVYTITGIHSRADWQAVRYFTWTLPTLYASYPQWWLEVSIIYYDSELGSDVTKSWLVYDDRFYLVASLETTVSGEFIGGRSSPADTNLNASATLTAAAYNTVVADSSLDITGTLDAEGSVNAYYLTTSASMSSQGNALFVSGSSMSTTTVETAAGHAIAINLDPRTYLANQGNQIFATNTPQVDTPTPATDTISIVLSSSLGKFAANSTDDPSTSITISGTKSSVNAALLNVYFYPTKGSSASGTFTWQQSLNSVIQFTKTINLTGYANAFAETVLTFTVSQSWTPTRTQVYYHGGADILIIGAGGNGGYQRYPGYAGGGGGAGGYISLTGQTLTYTTNALTIGLSNSGSGDTTAFGYTAYRGQDGANRYTSSWSGGDSGAPTSYLGNDSSTSSGWGGGGGAGAGAAGGAPTSLGVGGNGGIGIANNITGTSLTYCKGGGGGAGQANKLGGDSGLPGGGGDWNNSPYPPQPAGNYGNGGGGQAASLTAASPTSGGQGVVIVKIYA